MGAKEETERKAKEEAEIREKRRAELKAEQEIRRKAKEEADAKEKQELERKVKEKADLKAKQRVRIVGLKARPEFNGQEGCLVKFEVHKERWQVRLSAGEVVQVKTENLEEVKMTLAHNGRLDGGLSDVVKR